MSEVVRGSSVWLAFNGGRAKPESHKHPDAVEYIPAGHYNELIDWLHQQSKEDAPDLHGFVRWLFTSVWPHGDADGGDLQEMGVRYGILKPTEATEPCGEYCACAEWDDFPQTCYRLNVEAKP